VQGEVVSDLSLTERIGAANFPHEDAYVARAYAERLQRAGVVSLAQLVETLGDARKDPITRTMACKLVEWLRVRSAVPALADALAQADDDRGILWAAAEALARLGGPEATSILLEVLERGSVNKQLVAASALGPLGDPAARSALRTVAMDTQRDAAVRMLAIRALRDLQALEAVSDLITILSSESPELRYESARALGQLRDPLSIPALEHAAATDVAVLSHGRSVRQQALEALGHIRCGRAADE
jgi:HEAT repeat protein